MEFQDAGMDGRKGWIDLLRGSLCNHLESFPLWIQDTRTFFPGVDSISYKTLQLMRPVLVLWSIVSQHVRLVGLEWVLRGCPLFSYTDPLPWRHLHLTALTHKRGLLNEQKGSLNQ